MIITTFKISASIKAIPKHSVGYVELSYIYTWAVEKWNHSRIKVIFPNSYLSNLEFLIFFTRNGSIIFMMFLYFPTDNHYEEFTFWRLKFFKDYVYV